MTDESNSGNNSMAMISEHDVTRIIPGQVEAVRQQLIHALEQMGYRVISEDPLRARHGARDAGKYWMSGNVQDYPTRLEVVLRQQGAGTTQVMFDYQVQHGALSKGDYKVLTREAEAILALASQRATARGCAGCGAEVALDSRFCRKCGAPVKTSVPGEIEILRLTAGTRAGYVWLLIGLGVLAFASLIPIMFALKGAPMGNLAYFWMLVNTPGLWALGAGLRRLYLTLNPKTQQTEIDEPRLPTYMPVKTVTPTTNELNTTPAPFSSITEHTTDLLPPLDEAESISARRRNERSQA